MERQFGIKVQPFKIDNSGEYVNNELIEFMKLEGIIHYLIQAYHHKSNSAIKQNNRTLMDLVIMLQL